MTSTTKPMNEQQARAYVADGFATGAGLSAEAWADRFNTLGGERCLVSPAPMRVEASGTDAAIQFVDLTLGGLAARGK